MAANMLGTAMPTCAAVTDESLRYRRLGEHLS